MLQTMVENPRPTRAELWLNKEKAPRIVELSTDPFVKTVVELAPPVALARLKQEYPFPFALGRHTDFHRAHLRPDGLVDTGLRVTEQATEKHLQLLSELAQMFSDRTLRELSMMAVDQGFFGLDDPVGKYLPAFAEHPAPVTLTLRHLYFGPRYLL